MAERFQQKKRNDQQMKNHNEFAKAMEIECIKFLLLLKWTRFKFGRQNWSIMHNHELVEQVLVLLYYYYLIAFITILFIILFCIFTCLTLFVLDAHSDSFFIWFAWHETKENMRQTLRKTKKRHRKISISSSRSRSSGSRSGFQKKSNRRNQFWIELVNNARRLICTEIAFHVRISAEWATKKYNYAFALQRRRRKK